MCVLRSFSRRSSLCTAFLSSASTHASSRFSASPAMASSSAYCAVFVVRFTSSTASRSASALSAGDAEAMKARRFKRVTPV